MKLELWQPKEKDTAQKRNQVVTAINDNLPIVGGVGVLTSTNVAGGGTAVSIDQSARGRTAVQIAKIVTAGPNSEADYSDYRFWVQMSTNHITASTQGDDKTLALTAISATSYNGGEKVIVTAYDATAFVSGSHSFSAGTFVYVAPVAIDEPTVAGVVPRARWFILGGGGGGLPSPQYPGMVLQSDINNRIVFQFLEAHQPI